MNIVLIGMRGSGKTTVSKLLAKKLSWLHLEMDAEIEKKLKQKIADLVKEKGWESFRNVETKIVNNWSRLDRTVISAGGGVVTRNENVQHLKKNGFLILLTAPLQVLISRIKKDNSRPILTNSKTIDKDTKKIYFQRKLLYKKVADYTISTATNKPVEAVDKIYNYLRNNKLI